MLSEIDQSQKDKSLYHMRYLEWSNPQGLKVEWWLPGDGGKGERGVVVGTGEFQVVKTK